MKPNEIHQKSELAKATFNALSWPTPENLSKFSTELAKTDIECSQLSDREKEVLKLWQDLRHELFTTFNYDKARILYTQIDTLIIRR